MIKTLLKYIKKKWWVFLICIGVAQMSFALYAFAVMLPMSWNYHISDSTLYAASVIPVAFMTSLPLLIITRPASNELGIERGKHPIKYLLGYQAIFFAIFVILLPTIFFLYVRAIDFV
jgi:hypothetical protein